MGRYPQVKSTATTASPQLAPEDAEFSRGMRTLSEISAASLQSPAKEAMFLPQTPSPFMHPAHAPDPGMLQMPPLGYGYGPMDGMPIAFGDIPVDINENTFNDGTGGDCQVNYSDSYAYDPNTGLYYFMQYNGCQPMMGLPAEGGAMVDYGCMPMPQEEGGNTEQLLAALGEKIASGKDAIANSVEGMSLYPAYDDNGFAMPEVSGGPCDVGQESMMHSSAEMYPMHSSAEMYSEGGHDHVQTRAEGGGRKGRNRDRRERDRGNRGDRADRAERQEFQTESKERIEQGSGSGDFDGQQGVVNFTTVMFRNIPNKYTREMLVKQLEQDLKGHFDFVYLPIDFKNKCNVGYAFINFRSVEACETFLNTFNNVEVRKCLPGLNSRKVTEVTPARVQGFEENVQRLRNSPVMRELAYHPEWMPLVFDENGDLQPFPQPERALEPIKPRRRGREDFGASNNA